MRNEEHLNFGSFVRATQWPIARRTLQVFKGGKPLACFHDRIIFRADRPTRTVTPLPTLSYLR
jgi:hypothetical protein